MRSSSPRLLFVLACAGLLGCGAAGGDAAVGSGGTEASSGGNSGSGGSASSGGAVGSGGRPMTPDGSGGLSSGGTVGSGGRSMMPDGSGGLSSSGGAVGSGGAGMTDRGGSNGVAGRPGGRAGASGSGGMNGAGGAPGTGGSKAGSGGAGLGGAGGVAAAFANCPMTGHVTYTLTRTAQPTSAESAAYDKIVPAMDMAVAYYNCFTGITKADTVTYNSTVATADGNVNGSIRFGSTDSMNYITAMHEISHTVGIGSTQFDALVVDGIFTGTNATAQLRAITGNATDQVHGDTQHFWPNGLNYTTEVTSVPQDLINHCLMVIAIRKDMGMSP